MCQRAGREYLQREPPKVSITMIGLDIAKSVFQLHGIDASGIARISHEP